MIADLQHDGECVIEGQAISSQVQFGRRRSLLVTIEDETGRLPVRFFHFNRSQQAQFDANPRVRCYGRIRKGPRGLEMIHPQYDRNPKHLCLTP